MPAALADRDAAAAETAAAASAEAAAEAGEAHAAARSLAPAVLHVGAASASKLHVGILLPMPCARPIRRSPGARVQDRVRAMTEPWEMTATDALAAMRARDLSPVELLDSVERRARRRSSRW